MLRELGKQLGQAWKNKNKGNANQPAQLEPISRDDDGSIPSFLRDSTSIDGRREPQKRVTCDANSSSSLGAWSDRLARDATSTNQQHFVSPREVFQEENWNHDVASPLPPRRMFTQDPLQEPSREFSHEQTRPHPSAPTKLKLMRTKLRTKRRANNPTMSQFHSQTQVENDAQM